MNVTGYKKQNKFNFIIILVVGLLFIISITSFAELKVYFSLCDEPESIIIKNIDNAKKFIDIAMYTFTDREIAQAIIRAKDRGVDIKIYLDRSQVNAKYSKSRYFVNNGISEIKISSNNYIMHNKFAIIDNEIVITGSYNWTASAGERNNENLLVIDNKIIINKYQTQFNYLWNNKYSIERYQELISMSNNNTSEILETTTNNLISSNNKIININTASLNELCCLWGVGKKTAQNIINYRETHGNFIKPEDIKLVDGIDEKKWEKCKIDEWIIKVN